MIVRKDVRHEPPVFVHVDSCPDDTREPAFNILVDRVKEHMAEVCFSKVVDVGERCKAISNIEDSYTMHSKDVTSPEQLGSWECGYNVMYTMQLMTRHDCRLLKTLPATCKDINLIRCFNKDNYDAIMFRAELAALAMQASEEQRELKWINHTVSVDSTVWMPCQVLDMIDFGHFGVWYRLAYHVGTSGVRMWCKLPTDDCVYWKHTY
jgi:hypothetical protein